MKNWLGKKPHEMQRFHEQIKDLPADPKYRHPKCPLCDPKTGTMTADASSKCLCTDVTRMVEALTGATHWCVTNVFWNKHPHPYTPFREFHAYLCASRFNHEPGSHPDAPTAKEWQDYFRSLPIQNQAAKQHPEELVPHHIYDQIKESELVGLTDAEIDLVLHHRLMLRALMSLREEIAWKGTVRTEQLGPKFQ